MTAGSPPSHVELGTASLSTRIVWLLVATSLGSALLATLWFTVVTLPVRLPYWGEAEVVFEASRLRAHLPLYVDPLVGSFDTGEPPSRFYVTYPPIWSWVVSLVPANVALVAARGACTAAWLGLLAAVAWTSRAETRREAIAVASFVAGIWVLANFATIGRPDAIACALAAFALVRTVRRGSLDLVSVALFVLVPWVKPTLIGLPIGALVGALLVAPPARRPWRLLGAAAVLAGSSALVAHLASRGALFTHVILSNAQPFSASVWFGQVSGRLVFFAPLLGFAGWLGWRDRTAAGSRIGLGALVGATLWTLIALAKTGSSSNYWMEPCVAAAVLVAQAAPGPVRFGGGRLGHAVAALVFTLWADVASVRGAVEHAKTMADDAAFVASLRARMGLGRDDVIAADEAGIEFVMNGRILMPTYQMVHLVRRGRFPAAPWIAELTSERTRCFVEHTGQLRLAPELQEALERSYVLTLEEQGFKVWTRR